MNQTTTLIGYLGRTPEIRDTASRPYAVFAVATHSGYGAQRKPPTWNRCIVFDVDGLEHCALRRARSGEKLAVTGRWEDYTHRIEETGEVFTLRQLVVQSVRILTHKPTLQGDPDEPFVLPRRRPLP